jgi:hypothetical protein
MWPLRVLNHRAAIAPLALASVLLTAQAPLPEPVTDTETELGQAVYDELKTKGDHRLGPGRPTAFGRPGRRLAIAQASAASPFTI